MIDFRFTSLSDCKLIEFEKNHRLIGNITSINELCEVPFAIKRVYYLYDIPGGESRGGHAHKGLQQLIIAGSGSFDLELSDGISKMKMHLARPYQGVLLPPGIWRELINFSSGAICLVLASEVYLEEDYIRNYEEFRESKILSTPQR
jgi:hypothetical protein